MKLRAILFGALFLHSFSNAHAANVLDETLARLQKSYSNVKSMSADFTQVYTSPRTEERKHQGEVFIEKPGKMRWNYDQPKGRFLVSDGKNIVLYDPEDQQALVSSTPKGGVLPVGLSFLWGQGNLEKDFVVSLVKESKVDGVTQVRLKCVPREAIPNVETVFITVRLSDPVLITETTVVDALGGENRIEFASIKTNEKIPAKKFSYNIPKDATVVETTEGSLSP